MIIDPRDATMLEERPVYRVEFWASATHAEEWRIAEAESVIEVIEWVQGARPAGLPCSSPSTGPLRASDSSVSWATAWATSAADAGTAVVVPFEQETGW